jgi:hypothetical protein
MKISGMGINYSTGKLLIEPIEEQLFAEKIRESMQKNYESIRGIARSSMTATTFRGEVERERTVDLGDPRLAGWTFLVNDNDPQRDEFIEILKPLAEHRGMENPGAPLIFRNEPPDEWFNWLQDNYFSLELEGKEIPHYILVVGNPDMVPFHFQSILDSAASVGRLDFDSTDDLKTYVEKIIRLEKVPSPVVTKEAIIFATNHGMRDPTYYSHHYMAEPIAEHIKNKYGLSIRSIMGEDATKANLLKSLSENTPALVYTCSHGLGAQEESFEIQKRFNGAICCEQTGTQSVLEWLLAADDIPFQEPFLEGAVFFQFACFGYGTNRESDYMHWLGNTELNTKEDFVAALPKRLLAHPRGPIAFIGHLDTAFLHAFDDPDNPLIMERWHPRISPFVGAVDTLLEVQPCGIAMADINKRYDVTNAQLTNAFDRLQRGTIQFTPEFQARLVNTFILRSDAQNYMVFADPAARIRIPES